MNDPSVIFEEHIDAIRKAASGLISRSWAKSFFGNISILIEDEGMHIEMKERYPSPVNTGSLEGKMLLATRTTSTMKEVVDDPEASVGLYRITGNFLELIWGEGPPTSEISSHILAYTTGRGHCIVHCHMESVNRISEVFPRKIPLPPGYDWIGDMEPGSPELAEATRKSLLRSDTIIWKGHGALSLTDDPERCIARLIRLDRYLKEMLS